MLVLRLSKLYPTKLLFHLCVHECAQSCPTLGMRHGSCGLSHPPGAAESWTRPACAPTDRSPPGPSVQGAFSRLAHCGGVPLATPRGLPAPGTDPASPALAVGFFTILPPGKPLIPLVPALSQVPRSADKQELDNNFNN